MLPGAEAGSRPGLSTHACDAPETESNMLKGSHYVLGAVGIVGAESESAIYQKQELADKTLRPLENVERPSKV